MIMMMKEMLYVRELIIVLLLINACFYANRQIQIKTYRLNHPQLFEVKIKGVAYLLVNIICVGLMFFI